MEIDPEKYVVFRRVDLGAIVANQPISQANVLTLIEQLSEGSLKDAVVIRKRDKLAAGALHSYATACWTTADVLIEAGRNEDAEELTAIGDYFNEQYEEARQMQDHLPTL